MSDERRSSSSTTASATSVPPSGPSPASARTSRSPPTSTRAMDADGLLVPGVGAFAACMAGLSRRAATGSSAAGCPAGVPCWASASACRSSSSAASSTASRPRACDEWPGTVGPLKAPVVPHMGWNTVEAPEGSGSSRASTPRPASTSCTPTRRTTGPSSHQRRDPRPQGHLGHARRARSSPRWRTAPCGPPSSTPRSPATPAPSCCTNWLETPVIDRTQLELLPAVDVRDGQAVRLVHGESGTETSYGDPLEAALAWQRAGAEWLHLVDLDAAFGTGDNRALIAEVAGAMDIKVELSGGIRDDASLAAALATGCTPGQPRHRRPGDPRVGRQGHRRARRPDRGRPRRPRHHAARPRLDPRRRRPLRDARPAGLRGLRPLRRHRHRQGRHPAGPQPGPAAGRLRRHRPARRRLRRRLLAGRPARDLPCSSRTASRARSSARRCTPRPSPWKRP